MVNKRKVLIYCCGIIGFLIYLWAANDLVLMLTSENKVEKILFSELSSNTEVIANVGDCEYLGGLLEKNYFKGWAFGETEYDNSDKKISLIFKKQDSDECYMVTTLPQTRPDVYGVYRDKKNIYNDKNGLECQFSTIKIEDGIYDLYVYVYENEHSYGLYNTNTKYQKGKKGLIKIE